MSWRTGRGAVRLRSLGRALGLNRVVASITVGVGYERRFRQALVTSVRAGDTIWDVGANAGIYATLFSNLTGPGGRVFAFEPGPGSQQRLRAAVAALDNVTVMPVALGARKATVYLQQGLDALGATSQITNDGAAAPGRVAVQQEAGDDLVSAAVVASPNVIKIDTEGHELEVLRGLEATLRNTTLRAVCVEVHFGLLEARNLPDAPSEIEQLLSAAGFTVAWPDSSHIVARRPVA